MAHEAEGRDLPAWLSYLENLDPNHIELGLERVRKAAQNCSLDSFGGSYVIEVAGTNGKGSTAALIAAALNLGGIRTGLYTSPHLRSFNERIAIGNSTVDDGLLCEAFEHVTKNKGDVPLTYFEYTTLAALYCFKKSRCPVLVLEVGLGGRFDAVNMLDADLAIISSVGMDHMQMLGNTPDKIAFEKAGIIKEGASVITGNMEPAAFRVIEDAARERGCELYALGRDFGASFDDHMHFAYKGGRDAMPGAAWGEYPLPRVPQVCAPLALMALFLISKELRLSFSDKILSQALECTVLPGRMQKISEHPEVYLDVAHNVPAAEHLKETLLEGAPGLGRKEGARRIALMGMLKDKDIEGVCSQVSPVFDLFLLSDLGGARGEKADRLERALLSNHVKIDRIKTFTCVKDAFKMAVDIAGRDDQIIVFGSFVTVADALDVKTQLLD